MPQSRDEFQALNSRIDDTNKRINSSTEILNDRITQSFKLLLNVIKRDHNDLLNAIKRSDNNLENQIHGLSHQVSILSNTVKISRSNRRWDIGIIITIILGFIGTIH